MLTRDACEAAFIVSVRACDPTVRVREALKREPIHGAAIIGLAVGKAALAMARGAGRVERGLVVAPTDDGRGLPEGWALMVSSHPVPDERAVVAAASAILLFGSAEPEDAVLALISGGASALLEMPRAGLTLDELVAQTTAAMHAGMPIHELNELRTRLSAIKGGKLAQRSRAPITTLVISDVIGDDPRVIGSGPTVADDGLAARVEVIAPMALFGEAFARALGARRLEEPVDCDVRDVAQQLVREEGLVVAWGEPTVRVAPDLLNENSFSKSPPRPGENANPSNENSFNKSPPRPGENANPSNENSFNKSPPRPGENANPSNENSFSRSRGIGGRAQHLALELARLLRGTERAAFVAGSDGIDGPTSAAGAFVDGTTWDAIAAAGIDPQRALERCDSATALAAVGAQVITGPTGINHADVIAIG